MRRNAGIARRLDAAAAALAPRWVSHVTDVLGAALNAAPEPVREAVIARLRQLRTNGAADPAHHADAMMTVLLATAEAAPAFARQVAEKLNVELPAPAGLNQEEP
jgi:hypothetical protein